MTKIDLRYVHMPNKQERQDPLLLAPTGLPPRSPPGDLQSLELAEQATKLNIAADGGEVKPKRASNQEAERSRRNTIAWLIEDYLASNNFASKAERTKDDYCYYLGQIKAKFGDAPISDLEPPRAVSSFIASSTASRTSHGRATTFVPCSR